MDLTIEAETRRFDRWVDAYVDAYNGTRGKALRNVALGFIAKVIPATPVDTGRARGGWLPFAEKERPELRVIARKRAGKKFSEAEVDSGISESSYEEDMTGLDNFITIINGVPYIVFLNYGTSKQMGRFFVEEAMRRLQGKEALDEFLKALDEADKTADRRAGF
jgi:hypothetical protein